MYIYMRINKVKKNCVVSDTVDPNNGSLSSRDPSHNIFITKYTARNISAATHY